MLWLNTNKKIHSLTLNTTKGHPNFNVRLYTFASTIKNVTGDMAQATECLACKIKAPSSNPNTAKKKKKN
jgi:hypothetical protein